MFDVVKVAGGYSVNDRRDGIKRYLATRATRVAKPVAQMEFSF